MEVKPDASLAATFNSAKVRSDVVAIPLAIASEMFAFVRLDDENFTYGVMAGLMSAFMVSIVCVVLRNRSRFFYAPRFLDR